jgi:hypothetical protein
LVLAKPKRFQDWAKKLHKHLAMDTNSAPQDFLKLVEAVKDPLVDEFAKMSLGLLDKTQSDSSHCCYTKIEICSKGKEESSKDDSKRAMIKELRFGLMELIRKGFCLRLRFLSVSCLSFLSASTFPLKIDWPVKSERRTVRVR